MLNPARRSGERENDATRRTLERAGVEVKDASPAFDLTREKSMVVDGRVYFSLRDSFRRSTPASGRTSVVPFVP
nr:hypothetical protein Hi04_10k_c4711_00017 [uncultured bacterium]